MVIILPITVSTMQGFIIVAVLLAFCEHKTSNYKSFQKSGAADRYTLIEQSGIRKNRLNFRLR